MSTGLHVVGSFAQLGARRQHHLILGALELVRRSRRRGIPRRHAAQERSCEERHGADHSGQRRCELANVRSCLHEIPPRRVLGGARSGATQASVVPAEIRRRSRRSEPRQHGVPLCPRERFRHRDPHRGAHRAGRRWPATAAAAALKPGGAVMHVEDRGPPREERIHARGRVRSCTRMTAFIRWRSAVMQPEDAVIHVDERRHARGGVRSCTWMTASIHSRTAILRMDDRSPPRG